MSISLSFSAISSGPSIKQSTTDSERSTSITTLEAMLHIICSALMLVANLIQVFAMICTIVVRNI